MSQAEMTAHHLYRTMHLDTVSEDVKRQLMILMLSTSSESDEVVPIQIPKSYDEAIQMGAQPLECVREELHDYVNQLAEDYDIR